MNIRQARLRAGQLRLPGGMTEVSKGKAESGARKTPRLSRHF